MKRLGLCIGLILAMVLPMSCEAQQAGSMELVFTWPEGAPDFSVRDLYLRGELQVWPDGVDEEGNPVTVTQRFTGYSSQDPLAEWVKLGDPESLSFSGLSYGISQGVVIQVYGPNGQGDPNPPGDLLYYGRSQDFVLKPGVHQKVEVPLEIQAAPGQAITSTDPRGESPERGAGEAG